MATTFEAKTMKSICRVLFVVSFSTVIVLALSAVIASQLGYKAFVENFVGPLCLGMTGIAFVSMGLGIEAWQTPLRQINRRDQTILFWMMSALPLTLGTTLVVVSLYLVA